VKGSDSPSLEAQWKQEGRRGKSTNCNVGLHGLALLGDPPDTHITLIPYGQIGGKPATLLTPALALRVD